MPIDDFGEALDHQGQVDGIRLLVLLQDRELSDEALELHGLLVCHLIARHLLSLEEHVVIELIDVVPTP